MLSERTYASYTHDQGLSRESIWYNKIHTDISVYAMCIPELITFVPVRSTVSIHFTRITIDVRSDTVEYTNGPGNTRDCNRNDCKYLRVVIRPATNNAMSLWNLKSFDFRVHSESTRCRVLQYILQRTIE